MDLKREFWRALIGSLIFRLLLLPWFNFAESLKELTIDVVIFLVTSLLLLLVNLYAVRQAVWRLLRIYHRADEQTRKQLMKLFLEKHLDAFENTILSASTEDGVELDEDDVDLISRLCFEFGSGVYHGTDSNPPSQFTKKYSHYLLYHERNVKKRNQPGVRVLLVSEEDLESDYKTDGNSFQSFYGWHLGNSISLLQADPQDAADIAIRFGIPSVDLGIWDSNYVLLFCPAIGQPGGRRTRLKIGIKGSTLFKNAKGYFIALLEKTRDIRTVDNARVKCLERRRADWEKSQSLVMSQWEK